MPEASRREGFNANERGQKRESGTVTLGETVYHPVRLTNARLREVRRISREAQKRAREVGRETEMYREAYQQAREEGKPDEEAAKIAAIEGSYSDEVDEVNEEAIVQQLCRLLVDDGMRPPTVEAMRHHVQNDIDNRDQIPLLNYLTGSDPLELQERETTTS